MVKSMTAAIAGLKAHQTKMDVLGNNIANVNTWGYKSSVTNFQDAMYSNQIVGSAGNPRENMVGGVNTSQMGYGTVVSSISKNYSVGSQQYTGNSLDCMLDGSGFFIVGNFHESANLSLTDGGMYLTRVGILSVDNNGYLVNDTGKYVYGFATSMDPQTGEITVDPSTLIPLRVPNAPVEDANGFQAYRDGNGNLVYYDANSDSYYSVVENPTNLIRQYNQLEDDNTGYLVFKDGNNQILYDSANDKYYRAGAADKPLVTASELTAGPDSMKKVINGEVYMPYQQEDGTFIYQKPADGSYWTISEEKQLINTGNTLGTPDQWLAEVKVDVATYVAGGGFVENGDGTIATDEVTLQMYRHSNGDTYYCTLAADGIPTYYGQANNGYFVAVPSAYAGAPAAPTGANPGKYKLQSKNQLVDNVLYDVYTNIADPTDSNLYYVEQVSGSIYTWDGSSMELKPSPTDVYAYPTGLTAVDDTSSFKTNAITGFQEFQDPASGKTIYYDPDNKIYYAATNLGASSTVNPVLSDNRYTIATYTIGTDGNVIGTDINGKVVSIGMLGVASVENPNGLEQNSGYLYTIGRNAGTVVVGQTTPETGAIKSNYLEMSNTDLASDIATMITTQRGYQANTKIITVTDEMLEQLVNMKR